MAALEIELIPALRDNYIYLLHEPDSGETAVVDPAEAAPALAAAEVRGWRIGHILNTHHHNDHTGGNLEIKQRTGAVIVGPKADQGRIPGIDIALDEGDRYDVGEATAEVFFVPGHTSGHIAFWFRDSDALFCGDTLFSLGCGRLFEGTPKQMWQSLQKLRDLPPQTRIYCGHEYTQSNARFAMAIDPENTDLQAQSRDIDVRRADGRPTIPAKLEVECRTNPFLRADDAELAAQIGLAGADPVAVFAKVRELKDRF